ncbi:MAG: GreA/GreB family elongation factor, partial [Thermoanaerobaculia bacterium]
MSTDPGILDTIAVGRLDLVEDQWLARLDSAADEVDFFAEVAQAMAAAGAGEQLAPLLELADEHLATEAHWEARLTLLRQVAPLWLAEERVHPEIVRTLEQLYSDSPSYAQLAEHAGLFRAVSDIDKIWTKIDKLRALLAYEIGSVVWMDGHGAGRVAEINMALASFRVDFDKTKGLAIGFGGAAKMLQSIPAGHVIHRRVTEPEALYELKKSDPAELLRVVLASYDRPLTAGEVREILGAVVTEKEWTSWWTAARRHPQLLATGKGSRQRYSWASSADTVLAKAEEGFRHADTADRLVLYRKNAGRDPELRRMMEAELIAQAESAAAEQPDQAMAIWGELDRLGAAPADAAWSPGALLAAAERPVELVLQIADRNLRTAVVELLRELREDWAALYGEIMAREQDPRVLDLLAAGVLGRRPDLHAAFVERVLNEPRKLPAALVWLGERADGDLELRPRQALRLMQHLLSADRYPPFAPLRSRIGRLFEAGGPFPTLIAALDEELAEKAAKAVDRAPLDRAVRKALSDTLELRFPVLRDRGASALYALPESIRAKRQELKTLLEEEIPSNRRAIETAREMGDLRENFEYKAARQRHEYLTSRAERLQRDLTRARPIEPPGERPLTVRLGCRADLEGAGGERSLTILGPWESDPDRAIISYESDLGRLLLGRQVGDDVQLAEGEHRVTRIHPAIGPAA